MRFKRFSPRRLMQARERSGHTRASTIEALGRAGYDVSIGSLQNWERGWRKTPAEALSPLAFVYKTTTEDFYGGPHWRRDPAT